MTLVYDITHLHPCSQFARLSLRGENRDLRTREIIEHDLRHSLQRTLAIVFENEYRIFRSHFLDFGLQRCRDLHRRFVGNNCDPFLRVKLQANANSIVRTGRELSVNGIG